MLRFSAERRFSVWRERAMATITRWGLAIIGKAPLGINEALGLVVAGGGILLTILLARLVPEPTAPGPLWWLWWIVVLACIGLLGRVAAAIGLVVIRLVVVPAGGWLAGRLPYEIRPPLVRKGARQTPPLGILDFEQAAIRAMTRLTRILDGLTKDLVETSAMFEHYTPIMGAAVNASTERKIRIAREVAGKIDHFARRFEGHQRRFRVERESLTANYLPRLEAFTPDASLIPLRDGIAVMKTASVESRQSLRNLRAMVITLRNTNLHHSLNSAVDRLLAAVTELLVDYDANAEFATRALAVIETKIPKAPSPKRKKKAR
jgi:hypothetical protein